MTTRKRKKSDPISIRLAPEAYDLIQTEARRTKRSRGEIVGELAQEAIHCRMFPGIAFRVGGDGTRRPWIVGTSLDIWQIVEAHRDFGSRQRMAAESDLSEHQIRLALAYYERFPEEIDEAIADNNRPVEELLREYPLIGVAERSAA